MAIARAMLKGAPILAWDEATSALDSHTEVSIMSSMKEMAIGRTSLVIAHRLSTVMVRCGNRSIECMFSCIFIDSSIFIEIKLIELNERCFTYILLCLLFAGC